MKTNKIKIGSAAQDRITRFSGIVTARAEYLDMPSSVQITRVPLPGDSIKVRSEWFNEKRVRQIVIKKTH